MPDLRLHNGRVRFADIQANRLDADPMTLFLKRIHTGIILEARNAAD
jgi:hypothetical protein